MSEEPEDIQIIDFNQELKKKKKSKGKKKAKTEKAAAEGDAANKDDGKNGKFSKLKLIIAKISLLTVEGHESYEYNDLYERVKKLLTNQA